MKTAIALALCITATAAADALNLSEAVDQVAARVDVPVALPAPLPPGTLPVGKPKFHGSSAALTLRLPDRRVLTLAYGFARFDGCGPLHPRVVRIGGRNGVIDTHRFRGKPFTAVVWPATIRHPIGRYGVSGQFSRRRVLAWARSMARRVERSHAGTSGC